MIVLRDIKMKLLKTCRTLVLTPKSPWPRRLVLKDHLLIRYCVQYKKCTFFMYLLNYVKIMWPFCCRYARFIRSPQNNSSPKTSAWKMSFWQVLQRHFSVTRSQITHKTKCQFHTFLSFTWVVEMSFSTGPGL